MAMSGEVSSATSHKIFHKYCLVPKCNSTTVKTPEKLFISLPSGAKPEQKQKRRNWLNAMGRFDNSLSANTKGFICEDHFNLEEDMENYMRFKLMGGKIVMKPHVIPHVFECQNNTRKSFSKSKLIRTKPPENRLLTNVMKQNYVKLMANTTSSTSTWDTDQTMIKLEIKEEEMDFDEVTISTSTHDLEKTEIKQEFKQEELDHTYAVISGTEIQFKQEELDIDDGKTVLQEEIDFDHVTISTSTHDLEKTEIKREFKQEELDHTNDETYGTEIQLKQEELDIDDDKTMLQEEMDFDHVTISTSTHDLEKTIIKRKFKQEELDHTNDEISGTEILLKQEELDIDDDKTVLQLGESSIFESPPDLYWFVGQSKEESSDITSQSSPKKKDVSTQVRPTFRSKAIQCQIMQSLQKSIGVQCNLKRKPVRRRKKYARSAKTASLRGRPIKTWFSNSSNSVW